MYLLYIDDSGTKELKKDDTAGEGNSLYTVLAGILIKARDLEKVEFKFNPIKNYCFIDKESEIKFSKKGLKCNKNKCNKSFKEGKSCYRQKILRTFTEIDCTIFACGQNKYNTYKSQIVKNKLDIYSLSFEHLLKLIDTYMYYENISEPIVVFIDESDPTKDDLVYKAYKKALSKHSIFRSLTGETFTPSLNIVKSKYTIGCQLADIVAGSIFQSLEYKNKEYATIIKEKFYKKDGKEGKEYGYGYIRCNDWLK